MNIPITSRVKRAGKKGCGCGCDCQCGKSAAKKALVGDQHELPMHLQNAIKAADPEPVAKMWGPAKRKYGAKAVAKKHCY